MSGLYISPGNGKLGKTPNLSLPPWTTCDTDAPCRKLCYARKCYAGYAQSTVKPRWDGNLDLWQTSPSEYTSGVIDACKKLVQQGKEYFRWHVGGDVPDEAYAMMMIQVARLVPVMNFLVFTRKWRFFWNVDVPKNLRVIKSVWLGESTDQYWPCFQVIEKGTPVDATLRCPGKCDECRMCWHLEEGKAIQIEVH